MTSTEALPEPFLAALVAQSDAIVDAVVARLYAELASYAVVPADELDRSIRQIIELVAQVLRSGTVPAPGDIRQAERSSTARSRQDVPIHDIMQAFRFSMRSIFDASVRAAASVELDPAALTRCTRLLWSFSDAYTSNQVQVYRRSDIDRALEQARRRQQFLQALAEGGLAEPALSTTAGRFGLSTDVSYRAVRARSIDDDATDRLRQALEGDARRRGRPALFAVVGPECLGISSTRPSVPAADGVVAIGEPGLLTDLSASFGVTGELLSAAQRLGVGGVVSLADLSWRMAAVNAGDVGALLTARYLAPLRALGEFGEILWSAVASYLAADRNIPRAARRIPVHVNTLRYRLRRFEELTQTSLDATETIIELGFVLATEGTSVAGSRAGDG